jgi:ribonuclease HI
MRLGQGQTLGRERRLWVFCDGSTGMASEGGGGARGSCGAGAAAFTPAGKLLGCELEALAPVTNNEAEYAALLLAIRLAVRLGARQALFLMDSEVVVGQMRGRFGVASGALRRWHWQACEAARALQEARYVAIPREWNRIADGLACQAALPWPRLRALVAPDAAPAPQDARPPAAR